MTAPSNSSPADTQRRARDTNRGWSDAGADRAHVGEAVALSLAGCAGRLGLRAVRSGGNGCAGAQRVSALRAQMEATATAVRLSARLRGEMLPDVELAASDGVRVRLLAHVAGLVVIYFVPGEGDGAAWVDGSATCDAAQHRGYVRRRAAFEQLDARVFCVSSQPGDQLRRIAGWVEARHVMFSDPELVLAAKLGLPTEQDSGRYRRLAIVASDGLIERTFGPLPQSEAATNAHQVLTWLQATR